jgi:hypothetical protein
MLLLLLVFGGFSIFFGFSRQKSRSERSQAASARTTWALNLTLLLTGG